MKIAPLLLGSFLLLVVFLQKHYGKENFKSKTESNSEREEIKRGIETMKIQIKVIKAVKKDMDEKEWKIKQRE